MNRDEQLVSIIMPVYNSCKYVKDSIESVLNQTYKNWELIIIDDCSNDNSAEIVKQYIPEEKRIKLVELKENRGVANARNVGLDKSTGRYIAFLDSDDMWLPLKLEKQLEFMQSKKIGFSYTEYEFVKESGEKTNKKVSIRNKSTYNDLLKYNDIGCLTVMIDLNMVKCIKMPKIGHEDYVAWLNITKTGINAYGIKENLALYRKRDRSLSSNKLKAAKWTWHILRKVEKVSFCKSCVYFSVYSIKNIHKHILS